MVDAMGAEGDTPSDSQRTPIHDFRKKKDEREKDVGRDGRSSSRVNRYFEENPITSLIVTIIVAIVAMFAKDLRTPSVNPQGEEIIKKIDELHKAFDDLKGDFRALKDADVVPRLRKVEDTQLSRQATDEAKEKELLSRRQQWDDWRRTVDAAIQELRKK